VSTLHGAHGGVQRTAAGVFEGFARSQQRLLPHYAQATHFVDTLVAVRDDPVTADDLRRVLAGIGDAHRVGEHILLFGGVGLLGHENRSNGDGQVVGFHGPFPMGAGKGSLPRGGCNRTGRHSGTANYNNGTLCPRKPRSSCLLRLRPPLVSRPVSCLPTSPAWAKKSAMSSTPAPTGSTSTSWTTITFPT